MEFGSVCSGIEAASVAWHPLGWKAVWLAEIEKFPRAVLKHHYPDVPNLGDMTKIAAAVRAGIVPAPDVLVGGTPCQAFSVAGLRGGLSDPRGALTLAYVDLANAIDSARSVLGKPPAVDVWENVPGVLSSKDNAFGCFLAGLAGESCELQPPGGKWANAGCVFGPQRTVAWRVTDAQYFGVAQRRRRVFVVASARDGFDPVQVLFEFDGVRRDSAPSREAGEGPAAGTLRGTDGGSDVDHGRAGHLQPAGGVGCWWDGGQVSQTLDAVLSKGQTMPEKNRFPAVLQPVQCVTGDVTHTLKADGFVASEDGTGRGTPLVPVAFDTTQITSATNRCNPQPGDPCHPLAAGAHPPAIAFNPVQDGMAPSGDVTPPIGASTGGGNQCCVAFSCKDHGGDAMEELSPTLRAGGHSASHANAGVMPAIAFPANLSGTQHASTENLAPSMGALNPTAVASTMQVRRLTPRECERLQAFPDDYTLIPYGTPSKAKLDADFIKYQMRGNPKHLTREDVGRLAADGPRYKALGNSMCVYNMRWIGQRIQLVLGLSEAIAGSSSS